MRMGSIGGRWDGRVNSLEFYKEPICRGNKCIIESSYGLALKKSPHPRSGSALEDRARMEQDGAPFASGRYGMLCKERAHQARTESRGGTGTAGKRGMDAGDAGKPTERRGTGRGEEDGAEMSIAGRGTWY